MTAGFPRSIDEVWLALLSGILGANVADYRVTFLEGGNLADAYKPHHIRYAALAPAAPASLVLRFPHSIEANRQNAESSGAYLKEVRFFRDLAPTLSMRTPKLYGLFADDNVFRTDPAAAIDADRSAGARNKSLWEVGAQRSFAAMRDHGCLQRVQELLE
ncbi:MAG: hypothetical protein KF911_01805 [Pseudomonadales bacterium]|nr:hypothetical protein [Pseudomonadales bacterium]